MPSILLSALTAIVAATTIGVTKPAAKALQDDTSSQYETANIKNKVLKGYYDELNESIKSELGYKTFEKGYLDSGLSVEDYSEEVNKALNNSSGTRGPAGILVPYLFVDDARHIISNHRGSFPKPFDVLPNFNKNLLSLNWDQNHVMDFNITEGRDPDIPVYYDREQLETEALKASYVPSYSQYLMPGDIVWDTISSIPGDFADIITHMAMVVNPCKRGCYTDLNGVTHFFNFVETIEAFAGGVRFGFLDDDRILECGTRVLRVNGASESTRRGAVEFCLGQYGEAYELNPLELFYDVPGDSRNRWYCTQLVFSAYYQEGYDLTYNSDESFSVVYNGQIILPIQGDDIAAGDCITEVAFNAEFTNKFIKLSEDGMLIRLTNQTSTARVVHYADTLYFFCDALSNYRKIMNQSVTVYSNSSTSVNISTNLLATTAAVWYKEGNSMYVTLAHYTHGRFVNSFIKSTADVFKVKKNKNNTYTIKVTNCSSVGKQYYLPSTPVKYNNAVNKYYNESKTFVVEPNKTTSVTIEKSGNNNFVPLTIGGAGRTNNGTLIRLNVGETLYFMAQPASIAKPIPEPEPEPYVSPYPKIDLPGETVYCFDSGNFEQVWHGGTPWYNVEALVDIQDVLEWDWGSVEITDVILDTDEYIWNDNVSYDYETGKFSLVYSTFERNPSGCIRIRYTFRGSLYLNSISMVGNPKDDYFVGEQLDISGFTVHGQFTYGVDRIITNANGNLVMYSPDFDSEEPGDYTVCIEYTETDITRVTSYDVVVRYPNITSLQLVGDYDTVFGLNDEFNYDGMNVIATLEEGTVTEVDYFDVDTSNVDMSTVGTYEVIVTATVNDISDTISYYITVEDRSLVSITLSGNQQTTFEVGDEFNCDGLVVTAHYANGDERAVTDYTVVTHTIDMNAAGTYNVKVRYTENDITVNTTYQITVVYNGPALTGITLSGDYQTSFQVGESFNHGDLVVTAHYSDGTSRVVSGYSVMPLSYDPYRPGTYNVIVNYSDNGGFALTSYSVTVEFLFIPVFLDSITLSGNYKTNYRMGQALDFTGLVVTANYTDGSSEEVTDYVIDTSAVNMLLPGYYDVRVLYTFRGTTAVAVFTIHIGRFIKDTDLPSLPDDPIKPFPGKF